MTATTTALVRVAYPLRRFTRADALSSGALVDMSETGHRAGFRWPVALSRAAYLACVRGPVDAGWRTEANRLWDLLLAVRLAMQWRHWHTEGFGVTARATAPGMPPVRLWVRCGLSERWCTVELLEEEG